MIKELCCWHLHCCSPVLFLQTVSHGPYEKTDQLPITYFVWVVGIKTATEISWASITLCFFGHQNNMEMTEMVSVERYYMRCLDPRRKSQRSVFAQKNLSTQDVWTGWCLGFQVFFCKCLDSQDFAGAWAVCAQLGPCLDSQGSLQDLASLSCLSSVGEMLLSSMGAVFLSSVWAVCPLLEQCCCPLWEPCFWTPLPVELRRSTRHGVFIQIISLYSGTSVCENGKRYQRCSR